MISILIPTYRFNALPLAEEIISQAQQLSIDFELICMDDGSERKFNKENERINTLNSSRFIAWEANAGSISKRKRLAQMAHFNWQPLIMPCYLNALAKLRNVMRVGFIRWFKGRLHNLLVRVKTD